MTTRDDCIRSLHRAARDVGASPTKAQYEALGYTPASATIIRTFGTWNAAKDAAELETYERSSGGNEPDPKPAWVDLPDGESREELTAYQRWYHKNSEKEIAKKDDRRAELRRWLDEYKRERGCERCSEGHVACLDFHHVDPETKENGVARMVQYGYAKERIRAEIEKCGLICANCHRIEHYVPPSDR